MVDKHFFRHEQMGAWQGKSFCRRNSLLKNIVCCFTGLFLVLCLFWANTSFAAVESQIRVTWDYAGDTADLVGFRLYQDGAATPVCEVANPDARDMLCTVTFGDTASSFTMTAFDVYGNESDLSAPFSVDSPLLEVDGVIVDNGDPGTSFTGSWLVSGGVDPYGADSLYSMTAGDTYTFEAPASGAMEVSMWWTAYSNRCSSVPVNIYDGANWVDTVNVDQLVNGGQWNLLGNYLFSGTARVVINSLGGECSASADAIKMVAGIIPTANQAPIAVAVVSAAEGVAPLSVSFNGNGSSDVDGAIVHYAWDFGDGTSETGMLVDHNFVSPALYTVTLTVTDDSGATTQDVIAIAVSDAAALPFNEPPLASVLPSTTEGLVPLYVSFDAGASSDTDGAIVDYSWDFGDGAIGSGMVAQHSFEIAGLYTVTLVVTDDQGATAQAQTVVSVSKATGRNKPPKADFSVKKGQGRTKIKAGVMALSETELVTAIFDGSLSSDEDGTVVEYLWNFGDGHTAEGVLVEHTYAEVGDYTVALSVMDDQGATTQVEKVVSLADESQEAVAPVSPFVAEEGGAGCNLVAGIDDPARVGAWILVIAFLAWLGARSRVVDVKKFK